MKWNKFFTKLVFIFLLSLLGISTTDAQKNNKKITITGTVVDKDNNPIINAIVMIDGQKSNSLTDANGKYKVKVKPTAATLGIFTFGSGIKEEPISGKTRIDFKFGITNTQQDQVKDVAPGEEGVNTGYSYIKEKNQTNQITKIDGTKKKYGSYSSVSEMIVREVSGVKVSGNEYIIHDSKNLFGAIPALLVLDGVYVTSFDGVSPSVVESIEVLKGSSAAMYGSRGYGGVIIIKTKIKVD